MAFGWDDAAIMGTMALASAGASYASSAVNAASNTHVARKMAKYNLRNTKEQMRYQDELQRMYSKDMTKWGLLTNPAYKMAGLKAAGLNPILAYDSPNANLASASYSASPGASLGNSNVDFASGIRDGVNSALSKKRTDNETELKDANVENIGANTVKTKVDTDLNATKQATEERQQDLIDAQIEKTKEEAARQRLDNHLKTATNARDINRAKTEYEVESAHRPNVVVGSDGNFYPSAHDSPYGAAHYNKLLSERYLTSPERNKLLDIGRGAAGTAKAIGNLLPKKR